MRCPQKTPLKIVPGITDMFATLACKGRHGNGKDFIAMLKDEKQRDERYMAMGGCSHPINDQTIRAIGMFIQKIGIIGSDPIPTRQPLEPTNATVNGWKRNNIATVALARPTFRKLIISLKQKQQFVQRFEIVLNHKETWSNWSKTKYQSPLFRPQVWRSGAMICDPRSPTATSNQQKEPITTDNQQ